MEMHIAKCRLIGLPHGLSCLPWTSSLTRKFMIMIMMYSQHQVVHPAPCIVRTPQPAPHRTPDAAWARRAPPAVMHAMGFARRAQTLPMSHRCTGTCPKTGRVPSSDHGLYQCVRRKRYLGECVPLAAAVLAQLHPGEAVIGMVCAM